MASNLLKKQKNMLVFVNKSDPHRKIIVLGTMHLGAPKELVETYKKFIMTRELSAVLRPEMCLTRMISPYRMILNYLFSKNVLKSKFTSLSLQKFKDTILKTEKGKKNFDKLMKSKKIINYNKTIAKTLLEKKKDKLDKTMFMDIEIMKDSNLKCESLDDKIMFPFWSKTIRDWTKDMKKKEGNDEYLIQKLKEGLESSIKKILIQSYKNTTNISNVEKILLSKRNKVWYKKLIKSKHKEQIALVGIAHLRRTKASLKQMFMSDSNWDVYDFRDHSVKSKFSKPIGGMAFSSQDMRVFVNSTTLTTYKKYLKN